MHDEGDVTEPEVAMFYLPEYALPHAISLTASVLMLLAAWRRPVLGRALYVALFAWAAPTNLHAVSTDPAQYLDFANLAVLDAYADIIRGPFAQHVTLYVTLIATCQALIAAGLFTGGMLARVAAVGAITFLVAIAPFGVGSAFPCTLIMATGAALLLRHPTALQDNLAHRTRAAWTTRRHAH